MIGVKVLDLATGQLLRDERVLKTEMTKSLLKAGLMVLASARKHVPVDEGRLRLSINVRLLGPETVGVGPDPRVIAGVVAASVETGSKPHVPPVGTLDEPGDLLLWAMRHVRTSGGGKMRPGAGRDKAALAFAWALAMTIAKKGTKPHPYMGAAVEENREAIFRLFGLAIDLTVGR